MRISTNGSQELPVYATLREFFSLKKKGLPATQSASFYYCRADFENCAENCVSTIAQHNCSQNSQHNSQSRLYSNRK